MSPTDSYRELFNAIDLGFCTIEVIFGPDGHPTDYTFIDVNRAFEAQTGLHDAVGRRMRDLAPGHERHWFEIYGRVATTGEPIRFEQEAAALSRWFEVYAFRTGEPARHHVAILFRDITERHRMQRALDAALFEAGRASRAKDEFVAMLAHELRAPLAPMLTALEMMKLRGHVSREQEVIARQVRHLQRLVDDLLDVSRIAEGKIDLQLEDVELSQIVLSAMETAGPQLEARRQRVDVLVPSRGASVHADRSRMAQVLSNLLTNAAKYSNPGSRIVIKGDCGDAVVRVGVKDEGLGLAPEVLASIFEPYVQQPQALTRAAGGLGLGLSIVRHLVEAHHGRVWAESAGLGHGSEFIVELPAVPAVPPPPV